MSRTAEFKEFCKNISLNTNEEGNYIYFILKELEFADEDFLGKKTSREYKLLNVYQEIQQDEALEISKALSKKI